MESEQCMEFSVSCPKQQFENSGQKQAKLATKSLFFYLRPITYVL